MQDFLSEITKAEKEAEELVNASDKYAQSVLESAKKEIAKHKNEILKEAKNFVEKAIEEKKLLAQFDTKAMNEKCEAEMAEIEKAANAKKADAISYILSNV